MRFLQLFTIIFGLQFSSYSLNKNPFKKHGLSSISLNAVFLFVRDKEIITLPSQNYICIVLCMRAGASCENLAQ